jgi:hypothetical protein
MNPPARLRALREMTLRELTEAHALVERLKANHLGTPPDCPGLPDELAKWMDPLACAEYAVEHLDRDLAHITEMGALWARLTSSEN